MGFSGDDKKKNIQGRVLILSGPGARRAALGDMVRGNAPGTLGHSSVDGAPTSPRGQAELLLLEVPGGEPAGRRHVGAGEGASLSGRLSPEACSTSKGKTIWEPLP